VLNLKEIKFGSILDPILFLLYINNLPINRLVQEAETVLFAGDTNVLIKAENETL
jgi:hypothetical protein